MDILNYVDDKKNSMAKRSEDVLTFFEGYVDSLFWFNDVEYSLEDNFYIKHTQHSQSVVICKEGKNGPTTTNQCHENVITTKNKILSI